MEEIKKDLPSVQNREVNVVASHSSASGNTDEQDERFWQKLKSECQAMVVANRGRQSDTDIVTNVIELIKLRLL